MSKSWPMAPLGEVIYEDREHVGSIDGNNLPVFGVTNIAGVTSTGVAPSEDKSKYICLRPGRFVYNPYRINVGSIGLSSSEQHGIVSPAYVVFATKESLNSIYLYHYLKSAKGHQLINYYGNRGTVRSALRYSDLCKIPIPLPPLSEQKRIIARIEELAAKIEEAQGLRQKAVEEAEAVFDAYLAKIFDCAYLGISPIPISQTDLKLNEETRNPSVSSPNEKFFYIDISSVETGKINQPKELFGHEAPSRARRVIRANNVIMSTVRPNLKAIAKIPTVFDEQICSTGFAVFSCSENISPDFLLYQLFSPSFIDQCLAMTTGGHYPAINDTNLRKVLIFVPPLPEQRRIVAYLDDLQAKVDSLKHLQTETQKELNAILPSVLDKAFKGEL